MAGRFSLQAVFTALDHFSGPSRKITQATDRMQRKITANGVAAERAFAGAARAARNLALAAGAAIAAGTVLLKDVVQTGAEFESTMIAAAAKFSPAIRQGTKEFEELNAAAEKVGATTEFNAQQAAAALKDLASAGFGPKQAIAALPGVVDLATAAELDLAVASEVAGKSLGAFGLKVEDATQLQKNLARVTDAMSRTADATSANINGLFEAITEGAPVAKAAGMALEEFLAFAGQLANVGIEGSEAGTTMKNAILAISAPTREATEALRKLKVETRDADKNMRPLTEVFSEIEAKVKKMGSGERTAILEQIFGKIPLAGVSAILDGGTAKVAALRAELDKAGGSTATMAGIMRDKTAGDIDSFTSAIDGVKIAIFGVVKGPLREILQGVTKWVDANRGLIASNVAKFIERIGATIRAVAPLFKRFAEGFGAKFNIKGTLDGISAGFTDLIAKVTTPEFQDMAARWGERLGVVAEMVAKVAGAIVSLIPSALRLADAFQAPKDSIVELFAGIVGGGAGVAAKVIIFLADGLAALINFAVSAPGKILGVAKAVGSAIAGVFERLKAIAMPVIEFVVGLAVLAARLIQVIWEPIGEFFGELWAGVTEVASAAWAVISGVVASEYSRLQAIWAPIGEFFAMLWQGVVDLTSPIIQSIVSVAQSVYDSFTSIWSGITDFFSGLWNSVVETFNSVFGGILARIEQAIAFVRSIGGDALGGDAGNFSVDPGEGVLPPMRQGVDIGDGTITINDNTGRASVDRQPKGHVGLDLRASGAF